MKDIQKRIDLSDKNNLTRWEQLVCADLEHLPTGTGYIFVGEKLRPMANGFSLYQAFVTQVLEDNQKNKYLEIGDKYLVCDCSKDSIVGFFEPEQSDIFKGNVKVFVTDKELNLYCAMQQPYNLDIFQSKTVDLSYQDFTYVLLKNINTKQNLMQAMSDFYLSKYNNIEMQ